jgi:elongation factor G
MRVVSNDAMPARSTGNLAKIRNIGIIAHVDAGKTTTTERILYYAGVISRMGEVDQGSTTTDWMTQEQERGISITAASTTFEWRGHSVNLIDTPGHVDFTIEVERSLRVLDGAVAVFDAVDGVQAQSETVWRQADRYRVPRVAFINKCDRVGADPETAIASMRDRLDARPVALQLAWGIGPSFIGVIDVVRGRARRWIDSTMGATFVDEAVPDGMRTQVAAARDKVIEQLAEADDELMSAFISGDVPADAIKRALRKATLAGRAVPVLLGAAFRNKGIHDLLDAIVDYLPAPDDVLPVKGTDPKGQITMRKAATSEPLAALAFKVMASDAGPLTYVRVYAGCLRTGESVLNATKGKIEHVGRLVRMHANHREDVREIPAGMIGAILGGRTATTGDTLCDAAAPIVLDRIYVPEPVIGVVVEPATDADHDRLGHALAELAAEDPTFRVRTDLETGQTVISGMGELHLEILVDRLKREFGVTARIGAPTVAYRETITAPGEAWGRHQRVAAAAARVDFGAVRLRLEPLERGQGLVFENKAPATALPSEFVPAVEAGVSEAVERGIVVGFPATDIRVTAVDGRHHVVDSSALGYKIAGSRAFTDAARSGAPTVLEPVMSLEVVTPEDCVGDVLGDLHSRRGKVTGIAARSGVQTLACFVPLSTMFGYASALRSRSRGRATYSMEFKQYAEVPHGLRDDLLTRARA